MNIIGIPRSVLDANRIANLMQAIQMNASPVVDTYIHNLVGVVNLEGTGPITEAIQPKVETAVGKPVGFVSSSGRIANAESHIGPHFDPNRRAWTVFITLDADLMWSLQTVAEGVWVDNYIAQGVGFLVHVGETLHQRLIYGGQRHVSLLLHYLETEVP